ncbi:(R)-mandelonitrile lyase [Erwinia mallotivora]|uniref:Cupin n=1 Tax=Erwinia mallotivora TaxID=69222 RepID=A0A014N3E8_9GAMM|nr:cupin domain-containing protein [Erwinia mallotivora]EXU73928.1 cupin [Erwinia mallotivora]
MKYRKMLLSTLLFTSLAMAEGVEVQPAATQSVTAGDARYFSGNVTVSSRFQRPSPARVGGGVVTFAPAARTAWHTHPLGQTLLVTSGSGWVQEWGKPARKIAAGDTVWIAPKVKHWHGASVQQGMSHLAISEQLEGETVTWMEKVADRDYPR